VSLQLARRGDTGVPDPAPAAEPAAAPSLPARPALAGLAVPGSLRRSLAAHADPLGGAAIPGDVLAALRRRRGGGRAMPAEVSEPFGTALGRDVSTVRIHTDPEANTLARSVQSVAFSYGSDVYFSAGSYRPEEPRGQHLLAHELAHVVTGEHASAGGTVGRADDPAEAAADRTADRVVTALRRRAATPAAEPAPEHRPDLGALRRRAAQQDRPALRRTIAWTAKSQNAYARDRSGLLARLADQFPTIDQAILAKQITEIEQLKAKWTPAQAYQGIKNWLIANYAPAPTVYGGTTGITSDEARNYFVSNFKTFAEVVIDGKHAFKFTNITDEDMHAEDNFMSAIDKFVVERGWHEDFSESHSILLRINNSPCIRCAQRLYDWDYRDLFDEFDIQFANMYEKGGNFHQATTKLRSGGITMQLYSVTANLKHLLTANELADRQLKDNREALDFAQWLKQNTPTGQGGTSSGGGERMKEED